jgi:ATP-dependent helicase/nuclease subunit B
LYLSRSRCDVKDKPLGPSVFWRRIAELFSIEPTILPREQRDDAALIATPRQLVIALMRWVHKQTDGAPVSPDQPWPALYHWLATRPCDEGPIDAVRFGAWAALSYDPSASLTPDIAKQLFASPLRASVAQIEAFAACRFKHFLRFGLELQPRDDDPDVSALDLGQVYHGVLESVVSDLLKRRKTWLDLDEAQKQKAIRLAVEKMGQKLRGEILLSTARNRYLLHRIEKTLGRVIDTQKAAAQRGAFLPAFSKVRFGEGGALPEFAVPTPKKRELRLSGKIDRIDVRAGGDEFIAIDYRLTNHTLHLEQVYHGISLQLLTYLLVLEANGQALAGRKLTPAAAFYVRMLRWLGDVKHPSEALDPSEPAFALQAKPRGILDERYLHELDNALVKGASSEVINARVNVDGSIGSKGRSDLADPDEFAALLAHVRTRLGELADGILDGEIGIAPYMLGTQTPCPECEYRGVCRFEARGGYRVLQSMSREDVLTTVKEKPTEARHGR